MRKPLAWVGAPGTLRVEIAFAEIDSTRLLAVGSQVGIADEAYSVAYRLETGSDFVVERLHVVVDVASGRKDLELRRGTPPLVDDVLDCDLEYSPLFNTPPVLRDALHRGGEPRTLRVAFVAVPSLTVSIGEQRYEPVHPDGIVRYRAGAFAAEIEFDDDGFVLSYPELAERVDP